MTTGQSTGLARPDGPAEPESSPTLALRSVSVGYPSNPVLTDIDLTLGNQEVICLLGANGCGKTTLLKAILGLLKPSGGSIRINGKPQNLWSRVALAQHIGYVPQAHNSTFPFTVETIVLMGRTAHLRWNTTPKKKDIDIAAQCLDRLGISALRRRNYMQLSGGERQLVLIARALAQEPAFLIMDEPTSSLDFGNQIKVLEHIRQLRGRGLCILLTTHQPEQAARISDRVILLHEGRILASGKTHEVLTTANLALIYGLDEDTILDNLSFRPGARTQASSA